MWLMGKSPFVECGGSPPLCGHQRRLSARRGSPFTPARRRTVARCNAKPGMWLTRKSPFVECRGSAAALRSQRRLSPPAADSGRRSAYGSV